MSGFGPAYSKKSKGTALSILSQLVFGTSSKKPTRKEPDTTQSHDNKVTLPPLALKTTQPPHLASLAKKNINTSTRINYELGRTRYYKRPTRIKPYTSEDLKQIAREVIMKAFFEMRRSRHLPILNMDEKAILYRVLQEKMTASLDSLVNAYQTRVEYHRGKNPPSAELTALITHHYLGLAEHLQAVVVAFSASRYTPPLAKTSPRERTLSAEEIWIARAQETLKQVQTLYERLPLTDQENQNPLQKEVANLEWAEQMVEALFSVKSVVGLDISFSKIVEHLQSKEHSISRALKPEIMSSACVELVSVLDQDYLNRDHEKMAFRLLMSVKNTSFIQAQLSEEGRTHLTYLHARLAPKHRTTVNEKTWTPSEPSTRSTSTGASIFFTALPPILTSQYALRSSYHNEVFDEQEPQTPLAPINKAAPMSFAFALLSPLVKSRASGNCRLASEDQDFPGFTETFTPSVY